MTAISITPDQALATLDQPTRVYVLVIRAAERKYQAAVAAAARERANAIDEALAACELALKAEADESRGSTP